MAELRIADAEREEAVRLLGEQYAEGRLSKDELDERTDAAWSAKTQRDLDPLFVDLPVRQRSAAAPAYAGLPRPGSRPEFRPDGRRNGWQGAGRFVVPVLAVLLVLTVVTHLPFVLLAVLVFVLLARGGRVHGGGCGSARRT